jgi:MOSC domain-containing protein YiiM
MTASVHQLNLSTGGVPKRSVERATLREGGIVGDGHDHPDIHGGPERAVCLYALERIEALKEEGHPIEPGYLGENVTVSGLRWEDVRPGARLRLGGALVEVTRYTTPCKTIARYFVGGNFNRIHEARHAGWSRVYARVIEAGDVAPGDAVEIVRPVP